MTETIKRNSIDYKRFQFSLARNARVRLHIVNRASIYSRDKDEFDSLVDAVILCVQAEVDIINEYKFGHIRGGSIYARE